MKIFVLGSNGMLGHVVSRYFKEKSMTVADVTRKDLDAMWDVDRIDWAIRSWGITAHDTVINCIGLVPQVCTDANLQYVINGIFPHNLAIGLAAYDARLMHISTNCVYSGEEVRAYNPHGYTEYDMPLPTDVYGRTKYLGEPVCTAMVIRTSVIGPGKQGLYNWCTTASKPIEGYVDHYFNGLTTLELASRLHQIVINNSFNMGIHHLHSPNTVSKYDLIREIHRVSRNQQVLPRKMVVTPTLSRSNKWLTLASISNLHTSVPTIQKQLEELNEWY